MEAGNGNGNLVDAQGDPTDGAPVIGLCASHWKAAAADEKKQMWSIYDETGIFASTCRHGLILWIVDMGAQWRKVCISHMVIGIEADWGHRAKYPLAIVAKLMQTSFGKDMVRYDIGCEFSGTLLRSLIGPKFFCTGLCCCVNAFHGYSYSYGCQVKFHPNQIASMGLEDLETMEHILTTSNQFAYRHRALIALFFKHWDEEHYRSICEILYNNYHQALGLVEEKEPALQEAMVALQISQEDLETYEHEEHDYFINLQDEDPADLSEAVYAEALQKYWAAK